MRILFQKQTPKVVCHKCPSPILLLTPLSKYSGTMGGVQMKVIVAVSSWALLVLKSVGILPFISKVSITSSRTNPSFRPGSDCDIWQCMIQNRQGIEMAGAADGQDPIIQRPFFFFPCVLPALLLQCFGVSLACDVQLWQERRRNEVGLGRLGHKVWLGRFWKISRGYSQHNSYYKMLSKYCRTLGVSKVKFFFLLHCCLVGCLSLPTCTFR